MSTLYLLEDNILLSKPIAAFGAESRGFCILHYYTDDDFNCKVAKHHADLNQNGPIVFKTEEKVGVLLCNSDIESNTIVGVLRSSGDSMCLALYCVTVHNPGKLAADNIFFRKLVELRTNLYHRALDYMLSDKCDPAIAMKGLIVKQ